GAGAEADLPEHRGRRVPPLQALLLAPEALSQNRARRLLAARARRVGPLRRERGRRARLRLLRREPSRRRALSPSDLCRALCAADVLLLPLRPRRARLRDDLQGRGPEAAWLAQSR